MRISPITILAGLVLAAGCSRASTPSPTPVVKALSPTTLYLVNGRELAPGHTLQELDPSTITSVEHFVGVVARLRGARPGGDVVLITTTDTLTAARMTKP